MTHYLPKVGYSFLCLLISSYFAAAQTVTQIQAKYQNGQVFLTWQNLSASNIEYRIYRSSEKIINTTKLNSSTYMGFVRDNSSKNIRKSQVKNQISYFSIDATGTPLDQSAGLYVVTCIDGKKWFYAVTTVDLSTGIEDRTVTTGSNSLSVAVQEHKGIPQPILQDSIDLGGGSTSYEYVIWGNNQNTATMPAFNNVGSYGYNFTFIKHSTTEKALYIFFKDDDPFSNVTSDNCDLCNTLLFDDWLPNGSSTYWFGFNENYDMYSVDNPVQTSGVIRSYTQTRIKYILTWVDNTLPVDRTMVYASGFSHNGFGALLTSQLIPKMIAAEWLSVPPPVVKPVDGSDWEKMWCDNKMSLQTDILNPQTGQAMNIWDVFDMRTMFLLNSPTGIPFIGAVNGKQDVQIGWIQSLHWYDSLEYSMEGGVWYWDQRQHNGTGKQFQDDEIKIDFKRYSTAISYPSFSYCSINQNPGTGSKNNGDPYGAINGYLDWNDSSIDDEKCDYTINCFIKDMYVNGVLQKQYDSCATDVVLRRLQKFKPYIGATINWTISRSTGQVAANGTILYDGTPITLYNVPIYRSGSTFAFHIAGCSKMEDFPSAGSDSQFQFSKINGGYLVKTLVPNAGDVEIRLVDLQGRIVSDQTAHWQKGENDFNLEMNRGEYVLQVISNENVYTHKLFF